jgi:enoyl-CoA hydratase
MSDAPLVLVEQVDAVRRLTLNRPDKSNSISPGLLTQLVSAMDAAVDDPDTSVIIIAGAGKGFSAGFDISAPANQDIWADRTRLQRTGRLLDAIFACPIPVIAQVHGFALAGGSDLALHADFIICAEDARIGYPPVRNLGVPPTNLWLYRLGPQLAKRMLLTGDSITGAEAEAIGMAIEAVPAAELADRTLRFAQRVAMVSRECLIGNKAVINRGIDLMGRSTLNAIASTEDAIAHTSPAALSFKEAVRANGLKAELRRRDAPFAPDPPGIIRK